MANSPNGSPDPEVYLSETELNDFLDRLAALGPETWWRQQHKVVEDVRERCDPFALEQLQRLGIPLQRLIGLWNRRLRLGLRQDTPPERVLCGFNSVADVIYLLDKNPTELDEFIKWVARDTTRRTSASAISQIKRQALARASGPLLTRRVETSLEMLAAMLQAMQKPNEEWKPRLVEALWDKTQTYVYGRSNTIEFRMGGASGNMAYVLSQLGLDTTVHWLYHPREIASAAMGLERLLVDHGQKSEEPATKAASINNLINFIVADDEYEAHRRGAENTEVSQRAVKLCGTSAISAPLR
jgi:hypothetical protein